MDMGGMLTAAIFLVALDSIKNRYRLLRVVTAFIGFVLGAVMFVGGIDATSGRMRMWYFGLALVTFVSGVQDLVNTKKKPPHTNP
jgi:hypothetical protein